MKPSFANAFAALPAGTVLLAASLAAHADTLYWDGIVAANPGSAWATAGNWSTDLAGTTSPLVAPTSADDLIFNISGATARTQIYLNGAQAANSLTFNSSGGVDIFNNLSGTSPSNTLTIGSGGITMNAGAGSVTIGGAAATYGVVNVQINDSQTWTNNATNSLLVGGSGASGTTALTIASTKTLTVDGSGPIQIGAGSSNLGNIVGAGGIIKSGTGTLTLNSAGTYSGGTTLNAGTIVLGNAGALGTGGSLTINGGTIRSDSSTSRDLSGKFTGITVNSNFTLGDIAAIGALTLNAPINLGSATRTLTVNSSVTLGGTAAGIISGSPGVGIIKNGTGSLTLSGTSAHTFDGGLTVNGGAVNLTFSSMTTPSNLLPSGSTVALANSSSLNVNGKPSTPTSQTLGNLTFGSGRSQLTVAAGSGSTIGLTFGDTWTRNDLGVLHITQNAASGVTITSNPSLTDGIVGPWATYYQSAATAGNYYATVSSGNVVALTGGANFSSVAASNLLSGNNGTINYDLTAVGTSPNDTTAAGGFVGNTVRYAGAAAGTTNLGGAFAVNGLLNAGGGIWTISGGTMSIGSTNELVVNAAAKGITINSVIANNVNNASKLTISAANAVSLTAANTYTGGTTLNNGTLAFTNGALGTTGTIMVNGGGNLQWAPGNTQDISSRLTMVNDNASVFDTNGNNVTFASAFGSSASANLTKAGTGTLTLSGGNTYTGGTILTAGTLAFANGSLGTTGDISMNGGTLKWATGNTQDVSSRIAMLVGKAATFDTNGNNVTFANSFGAATSASLTKTGAGTLTLSTGNTYTGGTIVQAGTLNLDYTAVGNRLNGGVLTLKGGTLNLSGGSIIETAFSTTLFGTGASPYFGGSASKVTRDSGSSTLRMNAITRNAGATVDFGAASIADTDTSNVNGILGGWATMAGSDWAVSAAVAADTAITAYGSGSYTAMTATAATDTNNSKIAGDLVLSGVHSHNSLKIENPGATQSLAIGGNTLTLSTGGLLVTGTNAFIISGTSGATRLMAGNGSGSYDMIVHQYNSGGLTISAVIGNNGTNATSLTKSGSGKLILTATNTFSGTTYVNEGILNIQNAAGTGTIGGRVIVSSGAALEMQGGIGVGSEALHIAGTGISNGGALRNFGGSNTWGGTVNLNDDARINSDSGTQLTLNNSSNSILGTGQGLTIGGSGNTIISTAISNGAGTLTKDGAGMLTLNATNTYTGLTTVSAGTLVLGHATDTLANTAAVTVDGATAILSLTTKNDTVGAVTLKNGGSITGTTGVLTGASYAVESGSVSAILGGAGIGLTKITGGTVSLSSANTFSGNTSVNEGTLKLTGSGSLASATIEIKAGAFLDVSAVSGFTLASTQTLKGAGAVIGSLTVGGTLAPGASVESLATGAVTMSNGSTFAYEVGANHNADLLAADGTLGLTGVTLSLDTTTLTNLALGDWAADSKLTLISYKGDAITSGFTTYADDTEYTFGTNKWKFDYNDATKGANFAADATGTQFVTMTLVPEPSTLLLGGLGLLALARRRRV